MEPDPGISAFSVDSRKRIGKGSYGAVFRTSRGPEAPVIKAYLQICIVEWVILLTVRHPHLCPGNRVVNVDVPGHSPIGIEMPRYQRDLAHTDIGWAQGLQMLHDGLGALEHLHSTCGILHLDIVERNAFVGAAGQLVLGDFGLSIILPPGNNTVFSSTLHCSQKAPETGPRPRPVGVPYVGWDLIGDEHPQTHGYVYSPATDLFCLGAMIYRKCGIKKPTTVGEHDTDRRTFFLTIMKLIHPDPNERPRALVKASAEEFDAIVNKPCIMPAPGRHALDIAQPGYVCFEDPAPEVTCFNIFDVVATWGGETLRFVSYFREIMISVVNSRYDAPLTVLVVTIQVLLAIEPETRREMLPPVVYLVIQYVTSELIAEFVDVNPAHVIHVLQRLDGVIFRRTRNQVGRAYTPYRLQCVLRAMLAGRPVPEKDHPDGDGLPLFRYRLRDYLG